MASGIKRTKDNECTPGLIIREKHIILMQHTNSNVWFVVPEYTDNGEIKCDNWFLDSEEDARKNAIEIIEFDKEENGEAEEGKNYIIQKVWFDPNIKETL